MQNIPRSSSTYRSVYEHLMCSKEGYFERNAEIQRKMHERSGTFIRYETELAVEDARRDYLAGRSDPIETADMFILSGKEEYGNRTKEIIDGNYERARSELESEISGMDESDRIDRLKYIARNHEDFYHRMEAAKMLQSMADETGDYSRYYNPTGRESFDVLSEMMRVGSDRIHGTTGRYVKEDWAASLRPEWHPFLNDGPIDDYSYGSNVNAWWICPKGHEYQAQICERFRGNNCPYCSGRRVLPGFNDLATTHPHLAAEWHETRNGDLTPKDVSKGSGRTVWWRCPEGHEYEAKINRRVRRCGCPYCSGMKLIPGQNDLATVRPDLSREWNHYRNNGLLPSDVFPNSHRKVWWICRYGHEWEATVNDRYRDRGCPYCSHRRSLNPKSGFIRQLIDRLGMKRR